MKFIEELYNNYKDDVYHYLLHLTSDPHKAEDLLQETFVRSITSIVAFRGSASVKTWLFGIARNLWLQSLRQDKPSLEYNDLLQHYITEDSLEDHLIAKQLTIRVRELLAEKSCRTQRLVQLRAQGLAYSSIARELGISENSARVMNFRTRRWLKDKLREEGLI